MGLFSDSADLNRLSARLSQLERKVDAVLAHLQLEIQQDGMEDIRELVAQGKKIEAIKLYRERTGAGLAEAKDAIDRGV